MGLPKALATVLLPLGLVILLLAGALWALHCRQMKRTRATLLAVIALLWLGGAPAIADSLIGSLEAHHPPVAVAEALPSPAIVVLGGGVALAGPDGSAVPGPEAGRAWAAARLFRAGKAPLVVISAGGDIPEAMLVAQLLAEWSVPSSALVLETASRTTRENAVATRDRLKAQGIDNLLLVTTAMHMPRAVAAFEAAGLEVAPFPVAFRSLDDPISTPGVRWAPTVEGLEGTTAALLEIAARLYYRMRGWG